MKTFNLKSLEDWQQVVEEIVPRLKVGTILTLSGSLGAGKTTFVQCLARTLGVKNEPKSPTFALLRTHILSNEKGDLTRLVHVDAYRLERPEDLRVLNLEEEITEKGTILVIEWPENVGGWLKGYQDQILALEIEIKIDGTRIVRTD